MNKQITFEYNNVNYTLEFTRNSVKTLERWGFNYKTIDSSPVTAMDMLFKGAFLSKHSTIPVSQIEEIYDALDKNELLGTLTEMYYETVSSLVGDDNGNSSKNLTKWKVS